MTLKVPLDWDAPNGAQIDYHVQRVPAPRGPATRVLVYLAGGPGSSGNAGVSNAAALQATLPDMDVVSPDHRGTGRSTWLGCDPNNPSADLSPACTTQVEAQYGHDVGRYFSATQAARDVHYLVEALREGGRHVYLYGESYGTFLINRLLNMYPQGADAAVLDSVVRPDGRAAFVPGPIDFPPEHVARQIFAACEADIFCAGKLGTDPWARLGALEGRLASGYCAPVIPAGTSDAVVWLKEALYALEVSAPEAVPAFVHRLDRCEPADVAALSYATTHAYGTTGGAAPGAGGGCFHTRDGGEGGDCGDASIPDGAPALQSAVRGTNQLLYFNIELSDMFSIRDPVAAFESADAMTYVNDELTLNAFVEAIAFWPWPLYTPAVPRQWAPTAIPLLLLDGTLDTETPSYVLGDARTAFSAPHQQLIILPNATHVTLEHSAPTPSTGGRTCGLQLIGEFLADPGGDLDVTCAGEIPPLDFRGDAITAMQLFDTPDLYE